MKQYKRLTKKTDLGMAYCEEPLFYSISRLAELEDKIENGTLIELPKKCYEILTHDFSIKEHDILEIRFNPLTCKPTRIRVRKGIDIENFTYASIGKWVFLTKAEAEAKLKEQQNER